MASWTFAAPIHHQVDVDHDAWPNRRGPARIAALWSETWASEWMSLPRSNGHYGRPAENADLA